MADGVPGQEDPDLLLQVNRTIKRRTSPILDLNDFQPSTVVYKTTGAALCNARDKLLLLIHAKASGSSFKLLCNSTIRYNEVSMLRWNWNQC